VRHLTMLLSFTGLLLCLGAAATGIYWGMFDKANMTMRDIHLKIAIACVFVSMGAHSMSILMLRKPKS